MDKRLFPVTPEFFNETILPLIGVLYRNPPNYPLALNLINKTVAFRGNYFLKRDFLYKIHERGWHQGKLWGGKHLNFC
jgi:hypothetical protein